MVIPTTIMAIPKMLTKPKISARAISEKMELIEANLLPKTKWSTKIYVHKLVKNRPNRNTIIPDNTFIGLKYSNLK